MIHKQSEQIKLVPAIGFLRAIVVLRLLSIALQIGTTPPFLLDLDRLRAYSSTYKVSIGLSQQSKPKKEICSLDWNCRIRLEGHPYLSSLSYLFNSISLLSLS